MSKPVIEVKNLSKVYNINHEQKASTGTVTLRDTLTGLARKPAELITGHKLEKEKFWALKGINFQVNSGDVVGIVGRNGSGKSTLLKVLSRIVDPTEGEVIMRGNVASLLEVGTGFHPELTGRENIYFNGAILGMSQKEIRSKFDEIVEFSEVEKFLDTPVKFYSSGMYVRLAFSVAAHLDPDILIVDEVLAVGDAAFQKKCIGKMKDVAGNGRTVLFVSHSIQSIQSLCNKGLLVSEGEIIAQGNIAEVIDAYQSFGESKITGEWSKNKIPPNSYIEPIAFRVHALNGPTKSLYRADEEIGVELTFNLKKLDPRLTVGFTLSNSDNQLLFSSYQTDGEDNSWPKLQLGLNILRTTIPKHLLNDGDYRMEMIASIHYVSWLLEPGRTIPSLGFEVRGGLSKSSNWVLPRPGPFAPNLEWITVRSGTNVHVPRGVSDAAH